MGEWGGSAAGSTVPASCPVVWTNLVGVDEQDGDIIQNVVAAAWDNAGASSENVLSAGEDGWLTFTVNESSGTTIVGFAVMDTDQTLNNVDHGILIRSDGKLNVLESGIGQIAGPKRPDYSIGDELRIERANNEITYFHNGVPIHTSGVSSNADLIVDAAIYYPNGRISEVEVSFGTQEQHDTTGQGELTAALTASYPLDGNANDVSGNVLNGTVNSATLTTDRNGNVNSAYAFDGVDDRITIPDNDLLDFASELTVSLWVKGLPHGSGNDAGIAIAKHDGSGNSRSCSIGTNAVGSPLGSRMQVTVSANGTNQSNAFKAYYTSIDIFDNTWHHVAFTFDNGILRLFVDGMEDANVVKHVDGEVGTLYASTTDLSIGHHYMSGVPSKLLEGAVDDVLLLAKALTSQEISALASGQTPQEIDAANQQATTISRGLAHYDYGFRIYNPALGRFLSVDPLTKGYPMLTPYQFASNSPIDGVDLDGLEYLDADESRIEAKYGRISLKLDNFNYVFRTNWWIANMDPKNWRANEIGLNPTIANISASSSSAKVESFHPELGLNVPGVLGEIKNPALHGKNNDPTFDPAEIKLERPKNRFDVPNQRFKEKTIQGISTKNRAPGTAVVGAANIISVVSEFYTLFGMAADKTALESQTSTVLLDALDDLKLGIQDGLVPEEYLNPVGLSNILNVIIQGENTTDDPKVLEVGIKIVKEISGNFKDPKPKTKKSEPRFRRYGEE